MSNNIKNFSYMLFVQMANYVFPLVTIPIVFRIFGPEKIGLINYMMAIVAYFSLIISYSFNFTGIRRLTRNKDKASEIFSTIFSAQLLLTVVSLILFSLCALFIEDIRSNFLLAIITFSTSISFLFTQTWFLQAYSDFKIIALLSFVSKGASCILILVVINSPDDVLIYAAILNLINLAAAIISFFITVCKYKVKLRLSPLGKCISYLKEDRYLFLSLIVTNLYTTTGIVLLGALSTNQDVGYYSSAQKIIDVTKNVMIVPISQIIFPILSEKFGRHRDEGIDAVRKLMPIFILISLSMLIGVVLFSKIIVLIIFGEQFLPSYPMLSILAFGLFAGFYGVIIGGQVMLNLGLDNIFVKIQVIVSVFSLLGNYFILPYGGGMTTAVIWAISEIVISLYQYLVLKNMGVNVIDRNTFKVIALKNAVGYVLKRNIAK